MIQRLLAPLTPLYAAGLAAKNLACSRGWIKAERLRWPVISVGNLSVGGSGKTPVVIRLAELLQEQGVQVDVLSRGYGRRSQATERVSLGGSAERFGDEPLLIAANARVPVYVGRSRYEAGLAAEREASVECVHLLDDGFQHRQLERDFDIVVLHASDFSEWLLPAGRLREPLGALRRADALILRVEDQGLESQLRRRGLWQPVWLAERIVQIPEECGRVVAFCGIARPEEFFRGLESRGVDIVERMDLRDHREFAVGDIASLLKKQRETGADCFLTTEKDWNRMGAAQRLRLAEAAPLKTVGLSVRFLDEEAVSAQLAQVSMRK